MTVQALVATIAEIPAAAQFVQTMIPLPSIATEWAIVLSPYDHTDKVDEALACAVPALPIVDRHGTQAVAGLSVPQSNDLRAVIKIVGAMFQDPPGAKCVFQTALTSAHVVAEMVAAAPNVVVASLQRAGFSAATLSSLSDSGKKRLFAQAQEAAKEFHASQLVLDPRKLAKATPDDLEGAVPDFRLRESPTFMAHWKKLIAEHHPALSVDVWAALHRHDEQGLIKSFDAEHIRIAIGHGTANAPIDLTRLLELAKASDTARSSEKKSKKEKEKESEEPLLAELALSSYARAVSGKVFCDRVSWAIQRCDKGTVSAKVFWTELARKLQENPDDPLGVVDADRPPRGTPEERDYFSRITSAVYVITEVPKPSGAAQRVLIEWAEQHPSGFGHFTATFAKKVGEAKKAPAMPYAESDLAGLAAPLQKAWKTAREKSWKKEIRLPEGLSDDAIDKLCSELPAPLPQDVRSFYRLHNGAGNDECFRGCRLYDLATAVRERAALVAQSLRHPFPAEWLPITNDGAGNHSCVVLSGKNAGQIFDYDHESGAGRSLAKSFAVFVEKATWE
jgi:cell wall assembly regulator SMI1